MFQIASYKFPGQVEGNSYMKTETSDDADDQLKGVIEESALFKQLFDDGL